MIVSFVNAGLLSLGQSMAVIMGANRYYRYGMDNFHFRI